MDARLHQLQGKTKLVTETLALLQDFYREKLSQLLQHQAGARLIQQYDVNNTYQYIVNRDDVQLSWVAKAIEELGGAVVEQTEHDRSSSGKASESARRVIDEDGREAQAFVDRWRPRVESMNHARHRSMLRVILGEMPLDRQTPAIPDARRDHYLWLQFLKARQTVRRSVLLFLKELDMVRGRLCIGPPEFIAL